MSSRVFFVKSSDIFDGTVQFVVAVAGFRSKVNVAISSNFLTRVFHPHLYRVS
jgi:hypothetical protein